MVTAKNLCNMGTYLGFMFALSLLSLLLPLMGWPLLTISWMISATYLHILPFKTWVKTRLIFEATKLNGYYTSTIQLYALIELKKGVGINLIGKILDVGTTKLSHIEMEQLSWFADEAMNKVRSIDSVALWLPIATIIVTYSIIGLMYLYLKQTGFFRRIIT